jgi:hypothetical protein
MSYWGSMVQIRHTTQLGQKFQKFGQKDGVACGDSY